MKLLKRSLEKDKSGIAILQVEDKEDLWALYNLLQKDDELTMLTSRNVKTVSGGKSKQEKKSVVLTIKVEDVEYLPSDLSMRVKGRTTTDHEFVPGQSYHTMSVDFNKNFTLFKPYWDEVAMSIVAKACSITEKAEVGAIVLQEGVAHICLVTENMTVIQNKIEKSIPKKRRGDTSGHDKAMKKFYDDVAASMFRHLDLVKLKAILIVSPGFVAQGLYDTIFTAAANKGDKEVLKHKHKFIVAHSSTGYLQSLEEVLQDQNIVKQLSVTKFSREATLFEEFFKVLNEDNGKAWYGPAECEKAAEMGAVGTLMITDSLFRSDDIAQRRHYIQLSELVRNQGGKVVVFSTLHDSGLQLDQLTGVAVLLNYPVLDLEEEEGEEETNE